MIIDQIFERINMKIKHDGNFVFRIISLFTLFSFVLTIDTDYLNEACNKSVSMATSRLLESDTSLYYSALMSCYYTVTAPTGMQVLLYVRRFDLEYEVNGACVDFVNIHDGSALSDTKLNLAALCGETAADNYTASGESMTVYFETDGTGQRMGFDFLFTAFATGTCSSSQFKCNSSVCIDDSLVCNIYSECGDGSDETSCTSLEPPGIQVHNQTGLIAGLAVGLTLAVLLGAVIGYYIYRRNRWRIFLKRPLTAQEYVNQDETTFTTAYPVTKQYYKEKYQQYYRTPEMPDFFPGETYIETNKQRRERTKIKKDDTKRETARVHDSSSSSSQDPEWKMWGKTGKMPL